MLERSVTVDGLRLRVLEAAPQVERDDPVLMIHGVGGWAENWRALMPAVAASGRRALALDLPGFGRSERPRGARYFDPDRPFYARLIFALLDELGADRAHIAGHSFGGGVAYTAAIWRPERTRSLTLVAPGGVGTEVAAALRLFTLPGFGLLARLRRTERITREVVYSCFHDPSRCPEEVVAEAVRYGRTALAEIVTVLRASLTLRGVRDDVRRPWLERRERYRGPTLVVWGREDTILPARQIDDARQLAPHAELRLIPSCGHLVMIERPRELLDVMLPFLDRAATASAAAV